MLTNDLIRRAEAPKEGRAVVWDHDLPGFGVRVFASGKKSFIVRYRLKGAGYLQTVTLGTYGLVTLTQARRKAVELLAKAKIGDDPQEERKAVRVAEASAGLTVRKLVERYIAALRSGSVKTKRLKGRPATGAYVADIALHLERFASVLGKRAAGEIGRKDVVQAMAPYADPPYGPSVHRRMHGAVQRLYAWARQGELVENDPARDIETVTAPARERVLTLGELASVWKAADGLDPLYRDLVHLLIATGQRRNEVAWMRWSEIDFQEGLWTLPRGRTKARRQHVVPLSEAAVAVLRNRQRAGGDDLVLPTTGRDGRSVAAVSGWASLKRELDRKLTIEPWQMHDFRRSLVTHCAEQGADVAVLDAMLNHAASMTRGGIVGVYQKAALIGPMREVMQLWDRLLSEALSGERKVVRLRQRKG